MRKTSSAFVLLLATMALSLAAPTPCAAQTANARYSFTHRPAENAIDAALLYMPERGKVSGSACDCFWMQGGAAEAAYTFYRGVGAAVSFSGETASNLTGGNDLHKIDYLFGPRYTLHVFERQSKAKPANSDASRYSASLFGQALFGGVHAFDGTFPAPVTAATSANSFAFELGGGLNLALGRTIGLRLLEASYLHSGMPNAASNTQNDIRLGAGITVHLLPGSIFPHRN